MAEERVFAPQSERTFTERELLEEKERLLQHENYLRESLPHLYGWPWYQWAWDFYCSTNRYNFLCAANQISKSSSMIRKCINWATDTDLWPKLWKRKPTQFWYVYPSLDVATTEYEEKWVKEFLPRGDLKKEGMYAWEPVWRQGKIHAIAFASGVTVYFKSYEQSGINLQTSSVFALFCDEEMPVERYAEFNARISSPEIKGYFHMVFTATIGQEEWRLCIEEKGSQETFKSAWKRQVSCYDCKTYMDGTPSSWTDEYIQEVIDSCSTPAEVQRRVYGKFIIDSDRKYPSFVRSRNTAPAHPLPKSWTIWSGVDIGSGGEGGHPAAICYLGVNPEFTMGRVFKGWRGDNISTSSGDILEKYLELIGKLKTVGRFYDHASADFKTVSDSRHYPFQKADKGQDTGTDLLNTLFKLEMLKIYSDEPELMKLVLELESLKKSTPKNKAKDDFIDAMRFAVTKVPWDLKAVYKRAGKPVVEKKFKSKRQAEWEERKQAKSRNGLDLLEAEIDLHNEALDYGGFDPMEGGFDDSDY